MRAAIASATAPVSIRLPYRALALAVLAIGLAAGFLATPTVQAHEAIRAAGPELTRLLRMMAGLKLAFVVAGVGFAWWRLGHPVRIGMAGAYLASAAAIAAAPGLIWDMAHVVAGAALLHGGLVALVALGWFDRDLRGPMMGAVAARRRQA